MNKGPKSFSRQSCCLIICWWFCFIYWSCGLLAQSQSSESAQSAAQQAYDALSLGYKEYAVARLLYAMEHEGNTQRRRQYALDLGHLYNALQIPKKALAMFQAANALSAKADSLKAEGYTALAIGDKITAASAFSRAALINPDDALVHRQLGYLYRALENRNMAIIHFRHAIDLSSDEQEKSHLRKEVRALGHNFWGGVSLLWRTDANIPPETLRFGDRVLSQSQGIWEGNLRLPLSLGSPDRWIAGFSRILWSIDGASPLPQSHSLQGGVGLKIKPLARWNLVLGAERLIAIGDFARNDWLGRASISFGGGFEQPTHQPSSWLYWSIYGDMAAIGLDRPDLQASGEFRLGTGMTFGRLVVTPHGFISGLWQDDIVGQSSLIEGGPALTLAVPLGGNKHKADLYQLDLTLSYRLKMIVSSRNKGGLSILLSLRY